MMGVGGAGPGYLLRGDSDGHWRQYHHHGRQYLARKPRPGTIRHPPFARAAVMGEHGHMPAVRHCRHCWGDCPGGCLLPDGSGACIHRLARMSLRQRVQLWLALRRRS